MHEIEPFFNWRHIYIAEEDPQSPFFGRTYSEFEFSQTVYNYYIHPQWDDFGSRTLYIKIIYVDYELNFAIIEMIGEWNDAIENDIMEIKREIIDLLLKQKLTKFILITENVLNFHSSDKEYYQEWFEDVTEENGWRDRTIYQYNPIGVTCCKRPPLAWRLFLLPATHNRPGPPSLSR